MTAFVLDTSALVAVLNDEDDAPAFQEAMHEADRIFASSVTLFETSCVMAGDRFFEGGRRLEALIELLDLTQMPFDNTQLQLARSAYATYGRGSGHPAGLNMGDCFSYALAKSRNLPLLFKGNDFTHTDIQSALKPA